MDTFRFRCESPIVYDKRMDLHAGGTADAMKLEARARNGHLVMTDIAELGSTASGVMTKGSDDMENWANRKTLILGRSEMIGLLTPGEYNDCVEQAYRMHGEGRFYMDPKGHIVLDRFPGEWEAMPSYIEEPHAAACNGCPSVRTIVKTTTCRRFSRF